MPSMTGTLVDYIQASPQWDDLYVRRKGMPKKKAPKKPKAQ
jgi:hypothetical protein